MHWYKQVLFKNRNHKKKKTGTINSLLPMVYKMGWYTFINLFNKYVLSTHYVVSTAISTGGYSCEQNGPSACPWVYTHTCSSVWICALSICLMKSSVTFIQQALNNHLMCRTREMKGTWSLPWKLQAKNEYKRATYQMISGPKTTCLVWNKNKTVFFYGCPTL